MYCGSCGEALSATALFCRSCGASQDDFATQETVAPPPPAPLLAPRIAPALPPRSRAPSQRPVGPRVGAPAQSRSSADTTAAVLAIAGGSGMCFLVLYAIVYLPLHYGLPVNYGGSLQFGDMLTFGSGAVAIVVGALALLRPISNRGRAGTALVLAGMATIFLVMLWAYCYTFDIYPPEPFYFGAVYFTDLGQARVGSGDLQVPLLASSTAVFIAGCLLTLARGQRASGPGWQ